MKRSAWVATVRTIPLLMAALASFGCGDAAEPEADPGVELASERPESLEEWRARRAKLDETVWSDERLAQEHERALFALWDALLAAEGGIPEETIRALSSTGFETISVGTPEPVEELGLGITRHAFGDPERTLSAEAWTRSLEAFAADGLRLVQSEWHHADFRPPESDAPARSRVAMVLHVEDTSSGRRIIVKGDLGVEWSQRRDARGVPLPERVDATGLQMLTREGPVPFRHVASRAWREGRKLRGVHPVLVYDLDEDGWSDLVSVGARRVLFNDAGGGFRDEPLLAKPSPLTEAGAIADMNGDGHPDLVSTRARGDLVIYLGDGSGGFPEEPLVTAFEEPLRAPSAIALGDVDADGDLDVWLAQYKPAYLEGQMPSPFYDANDGYPSHFLLNRGDGTLSPATEAAGLAEKRFRRTYASSFVDLDEDGDLDLLVVSDYAGLDLYHNDGSGHFSDANHTIRGDRHLFGMSTAFADFDVDGRLDFFAAGMASTTARRLESLGLAREDRPDIAAMRMRMAFGNRMFLARNGGFEEPEFAREVARTGWTWGTTAFDVENDGDPDLFAANGHVSGETTVDYCSNFWTHDIYDGSSEPQPALANLFAEVGQGLRTGEMSWDGYQKNQLLLNRDGRGFTDVAFLLGLADQFDSRSAVSEDLDRDGRVDLVVVEDHGAEGQKLHVYRNRLETDGAWIGVSLAEEGGGVSPVGASVVVRTPERRHVGRVVTGETVMGQHSTTLHFGLGAAQRVEAIEVRWVGGQTAVVRDPELRRYHRIAPQRGVVGRAAPSGPQ